MKHVPLESVFNSRAALAQSMKKFEFRLEKLERVRGIAQDRAAVELARCEAKRLDCERKLRDAEKTVARCYGDRRLAAGESLDPELLLMLDQFGQVAKIKSAKAKAEMDGATIDELRARERLLARMRELKVVEKFHERKFEQHRLESLRQEQKEIDDGAGLRAAVVYR